MSNLRYKVWVKVAVEREDNSCGGTYTDVWESPMPVPVFASESDDEAIAMAERFHASAEAFAIDNEKYGK